MLIFIVGFMGCGKSTIGKRVARRIGYGFADTDAMIEAAAGKKIPEIFCQQGEAFFREQERAIIAGFDPDSDVIVATGGGAPCTEENLETMQRLGKLIYFRMSPERLFARLKEGREKRPKIASLNDKELMEYIRETLSQRERFYSQATMTIDCEGVSDEYIADHIRYYIEQIEKPSL